MFRMKVNTDAECSRPVFKIKSLRIPGWLCCLKETCNKSSSTIFYWCCLINVQVRKRGKRPRKNKKHTHTHTPILFTWLCALTTINTIAMYWLLVELKGKDSQWRIQAVCQPVTQQSFVLSSATASFLSSLYFYDDHLQQEHIFFPHLHSERVTEHVLEI